MEIAGRNKNFYMYLLARTVSSFGSFLSFFAIPVIIYSMYHSGIILSIFELISMSVSISFSIPFGVWMEGKNLKKIWISFSILLGVSGIFVFFYLTVFTLLFYNMICIFLFIGTGIAKQTLLVDIVKKNELSWANNAVFLTLIFAGIIAPGVGGYLLTLSWNLPFLADSATFFIEAGILVLIPFVVYGNKKRKKERMLGRFTDTLKFISRNKTLERILIISSISLLIGGGLKILNIAYFSRMPNYYVLYGAASSLMAVGMGTVILFGTFKIIKIKNSYRAVILSLPLYFLFYMGLVIFYNSEFSYMIFLILGVGNGFVSPNSNAVIQQYTAREHLTRVMGLVTTISKASRMASIIITGALVDLFSPYLLYLFSGILILLIFLIFYPTVHVSNDST